MSLRPPPALASWLLKRLARGHRSESLLGDLFEEYQTGRSPFWYWREACAALLFFACREACESFLRRLALIVLALIAQSALLLEIVTLSEEYRQRCPTTLARGPLTLMGSAGLAAVAVPLLLWLGSLRHPNRLTRRPLLVRLSVVAFAAVGFGGAALTWAGTSSCSQDPLVCPTSSATMACARSGDEIAGAHRPLGRSPPIDAPRPGHGASLP